jgi:hypothetical protein
MAAKLKGVSIKSVKGNEYKVYVDEKIATAGGLKAITTAKNLDTVKVHNGANSYGPQFYTFHGKQDVTKLNKDKPLTATIPLYDLTKAKAIANAEEITYNGVKYYGSVTPEP